MEQQMTKEEAAGRLLSAGIKPSEQRLLLYLYLWEHRIHPTVDTIYLALRPGHPTLSKTTVYNTLKNFSENHIVQQVLIEDGELRYDINTAFHGHLKCTCCNQVFDVFMELKHPLPLPPPEFTVQEIHLLYKGVCPDCRAKSSSGPA